jgi:hypothetical protein
LTAQPKAGSEQQPQVALSLLYAADLPFSFIGDVVTWPYTVSYTCINQPVPVPPVTHAKPRDDIPAQLPMPAPLPQTLPPPAK